MGRNHEGVGMASEKYWPSIILTPIGVSGTQYTVVPSTKGLKVKMKVVLNHPLQAPLQLEIKRVEDGTKIILGDLSKGFAHFVLPTDYVGGTLSVVQEEKYKINPDLIAGAVYEREPTVAIRTVLTDELGNLHGSDNPVPVTSIGAFTPPEAADTITAEYPDTITEIYRYRNGGTGGSILMSVTVTYTDTSKDFIQSAVRS